MSSFIKTKLKNARDFIAKKEYGKARDAASEVLSYEPDNYNANVFLGLACLELGEHEQSEQAYLKAISSNPTQVLAWTGLSKFYEQTARWDKYTETLRSIADMHAKSEDAVKCAEVLQKYIEYWRRRGTRKDVIKALELLLPESPLYPTLSNLPPPNPTETSTTFATHSAIQNSLPILEEIIDLTEREETESLEKEVNKRRQRLGSAGPEELKKQVGLEIWGSSELPKLYNDVIAHPYTSDELRRATEAKLLQFLHRFQCALPLSGDAGKRKLGIGKEVQELVDGVILLKIPNELAWCLYIEGRNTDTIEGYDFDVLRQFVNLFPSSALASLLKGYLLYTGYNLTSNEHEEGEDVAEDADGLDLILDAFTNLPNSILAHRVLGAIYIDDEDYQNAITVAERGLELVRQHEQDTGVKLTEVRKAFKVVLATGLVHLFPPKHHARAIPVLDDVLSLEPGNIHCLMGRGYVLQAASKWIDASKLFETVYKVDPDDVNTGFVAREEHAWCLVQLDQLDVAAEELQDVLERLEQWDGYETRKARLWWRLGQCYWRQGELMREKAYRNFITALKRSPTFAPAFTSLGIYYLESVSPPDPNRASKCFQKAFELDPRETDAARRLAHSFANEREWDLVEVVARRTIEGEGGLGGGLGDAEANAIAKHKPTNAWAWKALGVVELNRHGYAAAIQAFQVALRSDENDGLSWLRLGESYAKAGRHAAALKALNKAHELQPNDWMSVYQIGEVQRQTGQLSQAISTFKSVLETIPHETVVLLSMTETYLELGRNELATGYMGRASASFLLSISTALDLMVSSPGFRRLVWKSVSDALFALSDFSELVDSEIASVVFRKVEDIVLKQVDERLAGIIQKSTAAEYSTLDGSYALRLAVATCSYRLSLFSKEEHGMANAWFDLGVGLFRFASQSKVELIQENARKQAVESVRQALLVEPGNAVFWVAFGNLHFDKETMVAQHSYIKALEINHKDASVWANLGLLYLHNDDLVLANEALLKAQTLDPDYTLAWVGQGLVASANGHEEDANTLFEHAIGLTADLPGADLEYAFRTFNNLSHRRSRTTLPSPDLYISPFFSLDRYYRRKSNDPSALHLFGLVCERLHHEELGIQMISSAIKYLEAAYEQTEDPQIERRYAIANVSLGRLLLAVGKYESANESFDTAFGLLSEGEKDTTILRAICQFGSGIAHFRLGELREALSLFEGALEIASSEPVVRGHATVLLAQTLWAIESDESRELAKSHLLECINNDPENINAVTTLAGMGLVSEDEGLIDAAVSEIVSLPIADRHDRDPNREVENLLVNHYLAEGDVKKTKSVLQQGLHEEPSRIIARQSLASLSISEGQEEVAEALLSKFFETAPAYNETTLHSALRLLAISCRAQPALALKIAQRAIVLAPWDARNWWCLSYARKLGQ